MNRQTNTIITAALGLAVAVTSFAFTSAESGDDMFTATNAAAPSDDDRISATVQAGDTRAHAETDHPSTNVTVPEQPGHPSVSPAPGMPSVPSPSTPSAPAAPDFDLPNAPNAPFAPAVPNVGSPSIGVNVPGPSVPSVELSAHQSDCLDIPIGDLTARDGINCALDGVEYGLTVSNDLLDHAQGVVDPVVTSATNTVDNAVQDVNDTLDGIKVVVEVKVEETVDQANHTVNQTTAWAEGQVDAAVGIADQKVTEVAHTADQAVDVAKATAQCLATHSGQILDTSVNDLRTCA